MASDGFQFKQFYVRHDRCAMKVGTDGVLLGCWAQPAVNIQNPAFRLLDIGTGSGLIALMLAQRFSKAQIEAIDIDTAAVEQAAGNFAASPWAERLHAYESRLQEWQAEGPYDLIVSNPPYFRNSLKNPDSGRQTARHTDTLTYDELLSHSAGLLAPDGRLAVILPADAEAEMRQRAEKAELVVTHITRVFSKETKPARRVLLAFEKSKYRYTDISTYQTSGDPVLEDTLVLENETGGRSAAYQEITKDFYL